MKCYKHGDDYEYGGEDYTPTNDQTKDCNERQDVCVKYYWIEDKEDPPIRQTKRGCGTKEYLNKDGWQGSGCAKKNGEDGKVYNFCGCTTDLCNTATFSAPFPFLPLIALSFVKIFFI